MKRFNLFAALCLLSGFTVAQTVTVPVNRTAYPDYVDPAEAYPAEQSMVDYVKAHTSTNAANGRRMVTASELPDHWNNADFKHFPPVFNQSGGSCGSASRIGYMFTHELNSYRDKDGSLTENRYPTHFVWLLTYGNSGKDQFVQFVGVPSAKTYGGITTSSIYGSSADTQDNDFGWMQGYEKWYEGFFNRMQKPASNPYSVGTEEGRLATKAWLYNHCGDTDFHSGGLVGLGVASGGNWQTIPSTTANKAAGVNGMYYVHSWGTSVDHAVTMVGWDDRIEFDLDGNGVAGEKDKDEVGAWIIVNSWGGWCNSGFIYCPYANAGPVGSKYGGNFGGYWTGELYKVRKDYRPLRTIKLKMQYSRRSELQLQCGISSDLTATKPASTINMWHFQYSGDGNYGNTNPAPEIPMLGKWSDGALHSEAMEFGYDVTDLTAGYDRNKPLKYFFIVNTKSWAAGEGQILGASIIDYEHDTLGVETPFDLGEAGQVEIKNAGEQTIISVVVSGACYYKINSLSLTDGMLSWMAPDLSSHSVDHYNIYCDGYKQAETEMLEYKVDETVPDVTYSVTAVYDDGTESASVSVSTPVKHQDTNLVVDMDGNGFTIPDVFSGSYNQCTIEFWIKPLSFSNWNCAAGPGWGTWYQHFDQNGNYYCGWNTSARITSSSTFSKNVWQLISIVVDGNKVTLYKNGALQGTITNTSYSGIGGFGDFTFSNSGTGVQNAQYDEIRIWNKTRTVNEIKGGAAGTCKKVEFYGPAVPDGLIAYYKGDTFYDSDGKWYMRDCVGGHHAEILSGTDVQKESTTPALVTPTMAGSITIDTPTDVKAGDPVSLTVTRSLSVNDIWWTIPSLGMEKKHVSSPSVVFPSEGTYTVSVGGTTYAGAEVSATADITVGAPDPLDATFKATATSVSAGDRISFVPNTTAIGCSYKWHFTGAEIKDVNSVSAGATFVEAGQQIATLTVTSADGRKAESSMDIKVKKVAPKASFDVSSNILLSGESVTFTSTSKYDPTSYEWIIENSQGTTVVKDAPAVYTFTPEASGKYTVTLKAINDIGQNSTTKENVFVVSNDDSHNGLNFGTDYRTARCDFKTQPIPASTAGTAYTIDFWARINKLESNCLAMGCEGTFKLYTDEGGYMYLNINGTEAASAKEYVIAGEWHNYCIKHSASGQVTFWRDGVQFGTGTTGNPVGMPECSRFSIGTLIETDDTKTGDPYIGSIDELRFWGTSLTQTQMKKVINQHLDADDPEDKSLMDSNKLLAYYDFNQNGGETIPDRTEGGNDLTRYLFGPEGDAWGLSKGVFTLDFNTAVTTDVSTKLYNRKRSFSHATTTVNNSTASRFYKISTWKLENTTVEGDVTTGVHVDKQKSYDFTCTTGWDGFATELTNHKAYQTITLDPGFYTMTVTFGMHGAAGDSYLVAAEGTGLPDGDNLSSALGYNALSGDASGTCSMQFLIDEQKTVSLGVLVASMTGKSIFTIQQFQLKKSPVEVVTGINEVNANVNVNDNSIYDLSGRKLNNVKAPGLYIIGGKKVIR